MAYNQPMRKWIARFSFTLLVVGGLLFYEAYTMQTSEPRAPMWQVLLVVVGGALATAMAAQGIRMRHEDMRRG